MFEAQVLAREDGVLDRGVGDEQSDERIPISPGNACAKEVLRAMRAGYLHDLQRIAQSRLQSGTRVLDSLGALVAAAVHGRSLLARRRPDGTRDEFTVLVVLHAHQHIVPRHS